MKNLLLVSLLCIVGCGSTDSDDPKIIVTTKKNANNSTNDSTADMGISLDASDARSEPEMVVIPEDPKEQRSISGGPGSWEDGMTCLNFCVSEGFECENVEGESMGGGLYSWTNDEGNFTTNKQPTFSTCEEEIPIEIDDFGYIHEMQSFYCRCLAPTITRIEVPIALVVSCDTGCAEIDQACEPETSWGINLSGGSATYQGTDSRRIISHGCGDVPSQTITRNGRSYSLSRYQCGCTLP